MMDNDSLALVYDRRVLNQFLGGFPPRFAAVIIRQSQRTHILFIIYYIYKGRHHSDHHLGYCLVI